MKSFIKVISLVSLTAALSGCNDLHGRIDVRQTLKLNVVKGNSVVAPGSYESEIEIKKKKKQLIAEIEIEVGKKKDHPKIEIPLRAMPTDGPIVLRGRDIGQNFDILGEAETNVRNSGLVNTVESCTISVPHKRCHVTPEGQKVCQTEYLELKGNRQVEFYDQYTTRTVDLDLVDSVHSARVLASSHNSRTDTDRIYTLRGQCLVHNVDLRLTLL